MWVLTIWYLSVVCSVVIVCVSVFLALDFYHTQNGILRKLMIALFLSIAFIFLVGLVIMFGQLAGYWMTTNLQDVRYITATPLAATMLRFLYYRFYEMRN